MKNTNTKYIDCRKNINDFLMFFSLQFAKIVKSKDFISVFIIVRKNDERLPIGF